MHTNRVDVFDEAHGYHLVLGVANHFDLELLPVEDRFLDEALVRKRRIKPARADRAQLLVVVAEAAACATHRVRRTHHHGIADRVVHEVERRVHRMDDSGFRSFDA